MDQEWTWTESGFGLELDNYKVLTNGTCTVYKIHFSN